MHRRRTAGSFCAYPIDTAAIAIELVGAGAGTVRRRFAAEQCRHEVAARFRSFPAPGVLRAGLRSEQGRRPLMMANASSSSRAWSSRRRVPRNARSVCATVVLHEPTSRRQSPSPQRGVLPARSLAIVSGGHGSSLVRDRTAMHVEFDCQERRERSSKGDMPRHGAREPMLSHGSPILSGTCAPGESITRAVVIVGWRARGMGLSDARRAPDQRPTQPLVGEVFHPFSQPPVWRVRVHHFSVRVCRSRQEDRIDTE